MNKNNEQKKELRMKRPTNYKKMAAIIALIATPVLACITTTTGHVCIESGEAVELGADTL
jgi:hypothetical protein